MSNSIFDDNSPSRFTSEHLALVTLLEASQEYVSALKECAAAKAAVDACKNPQVLWIKQNAWGEASLRVARTLRELEFTQELTRGTLEHNGASE